MDANGRGAIQRQQLPLSRWVTIKTKIKPRTPNLEGGQGNKEVEVASPTVLPFEGVIMFITYLAG